MRKSQTHHIVCLSTHGLRATVTRFIGSIKRVAQVERISGTQSIWTLYYKFLPPVSPRVFTVLQTVHIVETSPKSG